MLTRKRADLFIGETSGRALSRVNGKADASRTKYDLLLNLEPSKVLIARGFVLDEVGICGDVAAARLIPRTWLELGGWNDVQNEAPPDSFWRTLVADRDGEGNDPPPWYRRICQYMFRLADGSSAHIDLAPMVGPSHASNLARVFMRRVYATIWNRRVMQTAINHSLGLIPAQAQTGDLICILEGCSVPVVVRMRGKTASDGNTSSRESVRCAEPERVQETQDHYGIYLEPYLALLRALRMHGEINRVAKADEVLFLPESRAERLDCYTRQPLEVGVSMGEETQDKKPVKQTKNIQQQCKSVRAAEANIPSSDRAERENKNSQETTSVHKNLEGENLERIASITTRSVSDRERIDVECTLIGECYMDGVMDGEAMDVTMEGGIKLLNFGIS